MAIQTVNLTVPGGDTPRSANTKINANFTDQTNAASRLLGTWAGRVPLVEHVVQAAFGQSPSNIVNAETPPYDINLLEVGTWSWLNSSNSLTEFVNAPFASFPQIMTLKGRGSTRIQIAFSYTGLNEVWVRHTDYTGAYQSWVPMSQTAKTYTTTTALGANVVVSEAGKLMRSASSERYKDILAPLELDDAKYADAMALKPIVYRSKADADNPAYHYYSFSAEELGSYDPAFTLWRETETVIDEDGKATEQPLAERQAEGININALLAMGHAIAIKQGELIKGLQDQVNEQREAIAALQQTNP